MVLEDVVSDRIGTTFPRGFAEEKVSFDMVRAGDLVTLNYGKSLIAQERTTGAVPVYGTNGRCGWNGKSLAEGPTVILGRKGMGPLGVEWCGGPFWVIDTAYYVTPKRPDLDLSYFYYLTKYIGLNHLKDGTSNPSLSRDTFYAQLLPLPTYDEQRRVASLFRSLDDKIDLNRRMNETLEAIARVLFRSWFVDFDPVRAKQEGRQPPDLDAATAALFPDSFEDSPLGPIPAAWNVKPLGECVELKRGYDLPSQLRQFGKVPIVSSSGQSGFHSTAKVKGPGVVTGRYGTIGQVFFVEEDFWPLNTTLYARDFKGHPPRFIAGLLELIDFGTYSDKAAVPGINRNHLHQEPVVVPAPAVEQRFAELVEPIWRRHGLNLQESVTLTALRDALLPKLLSGETRVNEVDPALKEFG